MTKREITSLAIKLMGVFILFKSVATVPLAFIGPLSMGSSEESWLFRFFMLLMSVVAAVIPLVFSVLVIIFSDRAAAWLIKEDNAIENTSTSISKDDVMMIAIGCIGLYFIVAAAPMFIHTLVRFTIRHQYAGSQFTGTQSIFTIGREFIAPAVQIALGVWLFVGSKGIVKIWKKIRS